MTTNRVVDASKALKFFEVVGRLKTIKRTGWVNNEIPLPESISDHMYRMSMMSFMIADPKVNKDRLMKVCLVHDLAESVIGDITPYDGVSVEDKHQMEEAAMRSIAKNVGFPEIEQELVDLWLEYEVGTTLESEVARQLDKYEMIVQANEYEIANPHKALDRFFESTAGYFSHPEIAAWDKLLREARDARLKAKSESSAL